MNPIRTFALLALVASCTFSQVNVNGNRIFLGNVDTSNATMTQPFRKVSSAPAGSCIIGWVEDSTSGKIYRCRLGAWEEFVSGGSSGAIISVFGRTGTVSAQSGDYSSFYPQLSGSYADPSWITSLSWSKLTGVPSTFTPATHTHAQSEVTGLITALSGKEGTITAGTSSQYYRGDKTWQDLPTAVRSAISATGCATYNSTTGVIDTSGCSGSAVSSVFGRTGPVVAAEADYQSFYARLSQSYANPSWITALAWSKLTGVPSTFTPAAHTQAASTITDFSSAARALFSATGCGTYNSTTGAFDFSACGGGSVELDLDSGLIFDDGKLRVDEAVIPRYSGGSGAPVAACTSRDFYVRTGTNQLYICPAGTWQAVSGSSGSSQAITVVGYGSGAVNAGQSTSFPFNGSKTNTPTTIQVRTPPPFAGTISGCRVLNSADITTGTDVTVTLFKNNTATAISIVMTSGSALTGEYADTTHTVSALTTDRFHWQVTNNSGGNWTVTWASCLVTP